MNHASDQLNNQVGSSSRYWALLQCLVTASPPLFGGSWSIHLQLKYTEVEELVRRQLSLQQAW